MRAALILLANLDLAARAAALKPDEEKVFLEISRAVAESESVM